ncbi:hypothetical protein Poli38472_012610 [Pythium oligandrum]|uniref:FYVE-type domain-containing protein n=1 Tax=Pythium oligandrum TaxID=41045 RepID=A0A8K1CDH7_PYTOL|nr:hypothetical protein Poli38472_012610 [Pythium oligandrum]|eukprot:TMW61419.1 hypothetical protein Poli38472_012610 [Pythium oligandrum]
MKTLRLPPNAIPPLTLTPEEEQWVIDEAAAVVAETVQREHGFLARGRVFPKKSWRVIKSRDEFTIYKERRVMGMWNASDESNLPTESVSTARTASSSQDLHEEMDELRICRDKRDQATRGMWRYDGRGDSEGIVTAMKGNDTPMMKGAGFSDGSVEDMLYGYLAPDMHSWELRNFFMKEKYADTRILATIKSPTPERPFDYIGIKWVAKDAPKPMSSFMATRDFLIVEANGQGVDDTGTPYSYLLMHSIKLRDFPDLGEIGVVRAKGSVCFISRQVGENRVHIFSRGFFDPCGGIPENVTVMMMADMMVMAATAVECSYAKKLLWMTRDRRRRSKKQTQPTYTAIQCESCEKTPGKFSRTSFAPCKACARVVCGRCSVQHKLMLDVTSEGEVIERSFPFCSSCIVGAKRLAPGRIMHDVLTNETQLSRYGSSYSPNSRASSPSSALTRPASVTGYGTGNGMGTPSSAKGSSTEKRPTPPPPSPGVVLY